MKRDWLVTLVAGAVVMGAGGAQLAPGYVPLVLADDEGQGRACAVSPDGRRLLAALRWLLGRCGWRRLAVLRDEAHAAKWQNFSSSGSLVVHEQALSEGGAAAALAALRVLDARVVVLDAGAAAAARALHAAAEAGMGPARGYAWLVLRAAGEDGGADWPPPPGFQYVTLSGWWRGGRGRRGRRAGRRGRRAGRRTCATRPRAACPRAGRRWPRPCSTRCCS
ncbi:hypothetical protein MSG28_002567 [Choristoneura fumiferana]|uniref:Uncharacterized protein n=1 Tax=Choristoneura fumiferana TaxID=7141 RepID=A0ACC0JWF1_CHOFU|nr:hypothetical protein MSG28_002567 [Choristoneura fumiferana]